MGASPLHYALVTVGAGIALIPPIPIGRREAVWLLAGRAWEVSRVPTRLPPQGRACPLKLPPLPVHVSHGLSLQLEVNLRNAAQRCATHYVNPAPGYQARGEGVERSIKGTRNPVPGC